MFLHLITFSPKTTSECIETGLLIEIIKKKISIDAMLNKTDAPILNDLSKYLYIKQLLSEIYPFCCSCTRTAKPPPEG